VAKLYFKYGTMGSSKSAQALMCKFNYEERGFKVLLLKSQIDTRDTENGDIVVRSRSGLEAPCKTFSTDINLFEFIKICKFLDRQSVVIVDEAQFLTRTQVEQLKHTAHYVPVICYGLLTNFKSELFVGSKRLVEIADSLHEIKSVCKCGKKANVNARIKNGKLITDGAEILISDNELYEPMCYNCYRKLALTQRSRKPNR